MIIISMSLAIDKHRDRYKVYAAYLQIY